MALCRFITGRNNDVPLQHWGWVRNDLVYLLDDLNVEATLRSPSSDGLLALDESTSGAVEYSLASLDSAGCLAAPVALGIEIWAAGVTYESSKFARMAESTDGGDCYAKVYIADRPELFMKATPSRCVGSRGNLRIRVDSNWNVPEPELAVLVAATGQVLGYTVGNDMSSRDIEGANPLYLPQAKVYRACCGLGPVVIPAQNLDPQNLPIKLTISRNARTVYSGETSTSKMRRKVQELVEWLFRENEFPHGVVLLTGTGLIPPEEFTLLHGDEVAIEIDGIGVLHNGVVRG